MAVRKTHRSLLEFCTCRHLPLDVVTHPIWIPFVLAQSLLKCISLTQKLVPMISGELACVSNFADFDFALFTNLLLQSRAFWSEKLCKFFSLEFPLGFVFLHSPFFQFKKHFSYMSRSNPVPPNIERTGGTRSLPKSETTICVVKSVDAVKWPKDRRPCKTCWLEQQRKWRQCRQA